MNDLQQWHQNNEDFLAAALHWLRLRLQRQGSPLKNTPVSSSWRKWFRRKRRDERFLPLAKKVTDKDLQDAAEAMAAALAADPSPALVILGQRFGLSSFEQNVLLLCAAMEFDTRIAALCAHAQHEPGRPYPTFALALALFDEPAWDVISPERPLRKWQFIEINQPGAQPLTTSPLRADERIVNYLKGLNYLDDRLTPLLAPFDVAVGEDTLPESQQKAVAHIVQHVQQMGANGPPPPVQLVGLDPLSKQLVAQKAAATLNVHLNRLAVDLLPKDPAALETLARLWQRESSLLSVALYLDAHEVEGGSSSEQEKPTTPTASPLRRFLARSQGIFFLGTRQLQAGLGPMASAVEVDKPTPTEQQDAWAEALEERSPQSPPLLAGQFNLNIATIEQIASAATTQHTDNGHTLHEHVWNACLIRTGPQMDQLAQRLHPKATWDDIVLPENAETLLHQIAHHVEKRTMVYDEWGFREKMNRGLGISALFSGDSGTGKTMAAEVIANELQLNLYNIDLSGVVSKYIGETEKNLRRLFDAAEDGGAILFFDEADALFGKRSEVKDSHDRYANIEINYLLQRMEAYSGLAILATNKRSALDQAFVRRLRFIINFPFPGRKERKIIWEKMWPAETPIKDLDFDRLARFSLAGGSIKNIAMNAAFMAARAGGPVTMSLVLAAARSEFRKMERPVNEVDFRWEEPEETRPEEPGPEEAELEELTV